MASNALEMVMPRLAVIRQGREVAAQAEQVAQDEHGAEFPSTHGGGAWLDGSL